MNNVLQPVHNQATPQRLNLQAAFRLGKDNIHLNCVGPLRSKRRYEVSTDSSLLETAVACARQRDPEDAGKKIVDPKAEAYYHPVKARADNASTCSGPTNNNRPGNDGNPYGKRARHKTRPDLYEPKPAKIKRRRQQVQQSRKHGRRSCKMEKQASGVRRAASKYVSEERLTVLSCFTQCRMLIMF